MDDRTILLNLVELKAPTVIVLYDPELSPEVACAHLLPWLGEGPAVVRLRGDFLSDDDEDFIQEAIPSDRIWLLIAAEAVEPASRLLKRWDRYWYRRYDDRSPTDSTAYGALIVLIPPGQARFLNHEGLAIELKAADISGETRPTLPEVRELGWSTTALPAPAMRSLCLLHHRDPLDTYNSDHEDVMSILNGKRPLTWRELQRVLRSQANRSMFRIIENLAKVGRVSSEQVNIAASAIHFLREDRWEDERIGGNALMPTIYHVLWEYGGLEDRDYVFRGQRSSQWAQETTLLRSEPDGSPASLGTIAERLSRTQAFLDELERQEVDLIGRSLSEDERLAIAQHYGLPTPLLDYTHSLEVAAFFATGAGNGSKLHAGDIGIIYFLDPEDSFTGRSVPHDPEPSHFARSLGVRLGELRRIEPELPGRENRIARQRGLFIDGFESRDLQRMTVGAVYFRQESGHAFEDPRRGITRQHLLMPDSRLAQLADRVTGAPVRISSLLASVRIPSVSVVGSIGVRLPGNLRWGQEFLNKLFSLVEAVDVDLGGTVRVVIERYLAAARIAAQTGNVAAASDPQFQAGRHNISHALNHLTVALRDLSSAANVDLVALEKVLKSARIAGARAEKRVSYRDLEDTNLASPRARIAIATGLFLIGLEHLQTVQGGTALDCFQQGLMFLEMTRTGAH